MRHKLNIEDLFLLAVVLEVKNLVTLGVFSPLDKEDEAFSVIL